MTGCTCDGFDAIEDDPFCDECKCGHHETEHFLMFGCLAGWED